jgi:hypothetical protein
MRGPPGGSPSIACRRALGDGPHLTFEDIVQALGGGPTQSRRSGRQRRARTMFLSMRQRSAASRPRASARSRSTVLLASHPAQGTPACAALKCSRGAAENLDIAEWNAVELCRRRTSRSSGLPPLRSGWPGGGRLGATSAYVHTTRKPNPGRTARRCHPRRPPTCSAGKRVLGGWMRTVWPRCWRQRVPHPPRLARPAGLTEREVEVVGLLSRGLQTKQIAHALGTRSRRPTGRC